MSDGIEARIVGFANLIATSPDAAAVVTCTREQYLEGCIRAMVKAPNRAVMLQIAAEALAPEEETTNGEQCGDCGEVILGAHGHCPAASEE